MLGNRRRIVTKENAAGRSCVGFDGNPGATIEAGDDGLAELWKTSGPPSNASGRDLTEEKILLEPPPRGSIFRFFQVAPESESATPDQVEILTAQKFSLVGASHCRTDPKRHPTMHKTQTLDYVVLLEGEVTLILDEEEVPLKPYDVVVQRGTSHAWRNDGKSPALLLAVLLDARE